ncbi:MAG: antitoxin family protein [Opitutaceae bacterium]
MEVTTKVSAVYEGEVLKLRHPLPLPLHSEVVVTVETDGAGDPERQDWMAASESALLKTWDNPADDVFNQLREA